MVEEEKTKVIIKFTSIPFLILCLIIAFIITNCTSCGNREDVSQSSYKKNAAVTPNITSYSDLDDGNYFYIVDENTGVVYLCYDGYRRYGMTVMFNADGTPVLAEDLGLK